MVLPLSSGTADSDTPHENLARFGWLKLDDNPAHEPCNIDFNKKRAETFLPFIPMYSDGGEYSETHSFRHLCIDDRSCYSSQLGYRCYRPCRNLRHPFCLQRNFVCRRSTAVNVVAKFNDSGYRTCTIDAVTIRTPMEGYNSPVSQVVVFASLGVPRLESVSNFDSVCSEACYSTELDQWNQQAHSDPTIPKPVAFISMRGKSEAIVPAAISRSSRYLVVKLLRAQGEFDNIDVEYVGAHGWSGRCLCPCSMAVLN